MRFSWPFDFLPIFVCLFTPFALLTFIRCIYLCGCFVCAVDSWGGGGQLSEGGESEVITVQADDQQFVFEASKGSSKLLKKSVVSSASVASKPSNQEVL